MCQWLWVIAVNRRVATSVILSALLFLAVVGTLSVYAAEDSWVSKTPMHEARSGLGTAVVNGKIYAIGGTNQEGFLATNEEYDPETNTWTFKASMPTARSTFGIAVYQNKIYCIGGYTNGFSATGINEVYDPATNTWETKTPMPTAGMNLQANIVNGKIYLIGGNTNGTLNQIYDPATDSWTTKASVPTAVSSYASAVVGNKIYVFTSKLNQIYDAENDSWSLGTPAPSPVVLAAATATTGMFAPEQIYVFGADAELPYWQLTTQKFTSQCYNPKNDNWTVCTSIPTGRYSAGVAVVDDLVYVVGGFTIEFRTERFTPNPIYTYSALNQQYTPIEYGTVPPAILVISPENKTYAPRNVSLTFTVNKPTAWLGYSIDGKETVAVSGNATIAGLSSGKHSLTVYANDTFGNAGASETVIFTVAEELEPAQTTLVAVSSGVLVAIIGFALLAYFKKRNH
jgi:N-acetylneuraminic acid mutarotase